MRCIVTAGPTFEPLDEVRRLTNFSTGRLGSELATFLVGRGHDATLLISQQATYRGEQHAQRIETFTTTTSLRDLLGSFSDQPVEAVFHAAAVSDFAFGTICIRSPSGEMTVVNSRKISTREGTLLAELVPTPKLISELRGWFPRARLTGWKYEIEGDRAGVMRFAQKQIAECRTDACVANGPAYGEGFGLITGRGEHAHLADETTLFESLEAFITA